MHVHSTASRANDEWYSRDFGCPESYALPLRQYELCKARGMSLVTLTDHDTIAGGYELIDRPDFFLSEEVTAAFPEDGCGIHILAWNITPAQHERLQAARPSVYDVVEVLRSERIAHACAHPLFSPNGKLTVEALEKMLLLFPIVEGVNGLMDRRLEGYFGSLLSGLDESALDALARRHRLTRSAVAAHRVVGGSDSHTERHVGSCFTSVESKIGVHGFLEAVSAGQATAQGRSASLDVMSLTASRVTYGFLSDRKAETPTYRDPFVDLVDVVAGREIGTDQPTGIRDELVRSLLRGASRTAVPLGAHLDLDSTADVMTEIRRVHDGLIGNAFEELGEGLCDLDMYRVLGAIRDVAGAVSTAIPFLFAANHFARERQQATEVMAAWRASPRPPAQSCLAIFSDTIDHVDGVTSSLRRFVRRAQQDGRSVRIPFCGARPLDDDSSDVYAPLASTTSHSTSVYAGMELHVPSPLGTIDWLWKHDITHVELATPGPMGIMGLLAARLLRLPVTASYHTEVPELLRHLSDSAVLHKAVSALVAWFYRAVDRVFVFSEASRQRLIQLGVPAAHIEHVPVAIDPHEFSPTHVSPDVFRSFGVSANPQRVVLTVGRLSREKNVDLIIEAIGRLQHRPLPPTLVVVGDGPERESLQSMCATKPYVVFAGLQQGEMLKRLYASADAFAFASRIDTLGLAPMEAMTSGVPVVVPADAAIAELVVHGRSGYCYEFGTDGLASAIADVLESPSRRAQLASNARQAMVDRWDQARQAEAWRVAAER